MKHLELLLEIKRRVVNEALAWRLAIVEISAILSKSKPWRSKAWAEKRKKVLLLRCEQCGSEEKPLVIQHISRPSSFDRILRLHAGDVWDGFRKQRKKNIRPRERERDFHKHIWADFKVVYGDVYGKESVIELIRQYESYLNFDNTKTFCKKCAFLWDKRGLKLCDTCKENYHAIYNSVCMNCQIRRVTDFIKKLK